MTITKEQMIEGFRGVFEGVDDELVFRTAVQPAALLISTLSGFKVNGPELIEMWRNDPTNKDLKLINEAALIFFCQMTELALQEINAARTIAASN